MLNIPLDLALEVIRLAREGYPDEVCGLIAGRDGACERIIPMTNNHESPGGAYEYDPLEQARVWKQMIDRGEVPVVIWHSHPSMEAYPSSIDTMHANDSGAHYLIVAPGRHKNWWGQEFRSYRILDGIVIEEEVNVT